jgi:hypothetical protein
MPMDLGSDSTDLKADSGYCTSDNYFQPQFTGFPQLALIQPIYTGLPIPNLMKGHSPTAGGGVQFNVVNQMIGSTIGP